MARSGAFTGIHSIPLKPTALSVTYGRTGGSEIDATYNDWSIVGQYSGVVVGFRFTSSGDIILK